MHSSLTAAYIGVESLNHKPVATLKEGEVNALLINSLNISVKAVECAIANVEASNELIIYLLEKQLGM